jgi:hypothetical protein
MVTVSDELDYFGLYFISNFYIPIPPQIKSVEKIVIISATYDFDDYFLYQAKRHRKVPKPGQYMPKYYYRIILALENSNIARKTEAICQLLDFNYGYRREIEKNIRAALYKSKENGGKLRDFTIIDNESGIGFTYFCGNGNTTTNLIPTSFLLTKIPEFCQEKFLLYDAQSWVGFAKDTTIKKTFTLACLIDNKFY